LNNSEDITGTACTFLFASLAFANGHTFFFTMNTVNKYALVCVEMVLRLASLPEQITKKQALINVAATAALGVVFFAGLHLAQHNAVVDFTTGCLVKLNNSEDITGTACTSLFVEFTLRNRQFISRMNMTPCDQISALEESRFEAFLSWVNLDVAMDVYLNWNNGVKLTEDKATAIDAELAVRNEKVARKRDAFHCRTQNAPSFEEAAPLDWCLTGIICPARNCSDAIWDLRVEGYHETVNSKNYQAALEYIRTRIDKDMCMHYIRDFLLSKTGDSFVQELAWNTSS